MSLSSKSLNIKSSEIRLLRLPLISTFTTGFGSISYKETILLKLVGGNGVCGWGEGAALPFPNYSPETTQTTLLGLKEYILPLLLNKSFMNPEEVYNTLSCIKGFNFAKAAVDCAFWMMFSTINQTSISRSLGGVWEKVGIGESVGIKKSFEETANEINLRLEQGYQRIKIKIKPGWDIKLIEFIRNKFGNIKLIVDGNSSYTLRDLEVLKILDKFHLLMIEQPLGDTDLIDHATLQKQIKTPICLDESILSAEDARRAVENGACKIINIKTGRVGGITEGKKIHDYCKQNNVGVWCGGLLESGIGRAFNIALASLPGFVYPADMSPYSIFYKEDLIEPSYEVDQEGFIKVPDKPGLGYNLDNKRINKYTQYKFCFQS